MPNLTGKIIIPCGVNVWPHEYRTALALVNAGYTIEFIRKSNRDGESSADVFIEAHKWEFKAPTASKIQAVERNLKRASLQSDKLVFDSRRMKRIPDKAILRELSKQLQKSSVISKILFVNRHGAVVEVE